MQAGKIVDVYSAEFTPCINKQPPTPFWFTVMPNYINYVGAKKERTKIRKAEVLAFLCSEIFLAGHL